MKADDPLIQQAISAKMQEKIDVRQKPDGETMQQFIEWYDAALADAIYEVLKDAEPVGEFWEGR